MSVLRRKRAFTVVEMLVVISIIGVLMALLLPAVQVARETARRAACTSNIQQIVKAGLLHQTRTQYLPPSRSWVPGVLGPNASHPAAYDEAFSFTWVQPMLVDLDQRTVWEAMRLSPVANQAGLPPGMTSLQLPILMCPSDTYEGPASAAPLAYGINGGRINYTGDLTPADPRGPVTNHDWAANGGSDDRLRPNTVADHADFRVNRMRLDSLRDGAGMTIAFAENVYLRNWCRIGGENITEFHSAVVWDPSGSIPPVADEATIENGVLGGAAYAIPASRHPGGFNMAFWDGSARFVNETIDYNVYYRLMSSEGMRTRAPIMNDYSNSPNPLDQSMPLGNIEF